MMLDAHLVLEVIISALGFVLAGLLGLASFFLRRILSEHEKVGEVVRLHSTEIALLKAELARYREDSTQQRILLDDLRGFLSSEGFRKRGAS